MSRKSGGERAVVDRVQVIDVNPSCPRLSLVRGGGAAWAVIWPGNGAQSRSMHLFELDEGSETVVMEHPSEATYYVIQGAAVATDASDDSEQMAETGSMIFVEPQTRYVISAEGGSTRFVGGPCPPDPKLYQRMSDV
jgi:mannose-6-phosphate isomerase-like protein (cupin superfamily)